MSSELREAKSKSVWMKGNSCQEFTACTVEMHVHIVVKISKCYLIEYFSTCLMWTLHVVDIIVISEIWANGRKCT